jgi:hypothetical protein
MEKIIIKPEAAYYGYYDEDADAWIEKDLIESSLPISWYADMPVEIVGKVSIKRIFELFERYEDQLTFMYAKALKTLTFREVMKFTETEEISEDIPVKSLCLVWAGEILEQAEDEYIIISSVLVGLDTDEEDEDVDDDGVYQLTNFDFIQWASIPVYIDNYLDFAKGREENIIFGGVYPWKFGNFLDCILSEISLNLFLSGQASNPDVVVKERTNTMGVRELFKYIDELENFSSDF